MAELGHQPGSGEAPQRSLLVKVEDHGFLSGTPNQERDDAVVTNLGALHDALIAVDPHALRVARPYDIDSQHRPTRAAVSSRERLIPAAGSACARCQRSPWECRSGLWRLVAVRNDRGVSWSLHQNRHPMLGPATRIAMAHPLVYFEIRSSDPNAARDFSGRRGGRRY